VEKKQLRPQSARIGMSKLKRAECRRALKKRERKISLFGKRREPVNGICEQAKISKGGPDEGEREAPFADALEKETWEGFVGRKKTIKLDIEMKSQFCSKKGAS